MYYIPLLNFIFVSSHGQTKASDHGKGGKFTIYQPIILYRKFSADKIFDGYRFLEQKVLITTCTGTVVELVDERDAGDTIERSGGVLCPGFINAHCHLELSHLKGRIPKHTGLVNFIIKVVTERGLAGNQPGDAEQQVLEAIEKAEDEMIRSGIVATGDICNTTLTLPQKTRKRLLYHNFIEAMGFIPAMAKERFQKTVSILDEFRSGIHYQVSGISPHAPYSVSPQMFDLINNLPDNNLITIHNQETAAENEFFEKGTGDFLRLYQQMGIDISFYRPSGKTSLQTWLPYFTKGQTIILVHNVVTTASDIEFANQKLKTQNPGFFYCLCPNANRYISNELPDVHMLMQHTGNIVLGTDSLASNDALSILAEIKTLQENFKGMDLPVLLKWATSNGAKALQLDDRLGSFEKGKQPGVLLIDETGLEKVERLI